MQSESRANGPEGRTNWDLVNWREASEAVINLRQRIFKAARENDHCRVRSLQRLKLRSHANILMSVRQVTQTATSRKPDGSLAPAKEAILLMRLWIQAVSDLLEPCEAKVSSTVVRPGRLVCPAGVSPVGARIGSPVAWRAGPEGNRRP